MTALVRSELLKVRTTRGWWFYLIVLVGLVGIGTAAEVGSRSVGERSGLDFQLALVDLVGITSLLAIILGITMVTTEFRHGTITPTLLATPGRERVLAGKAVAGVLVAVFFAVLAFVVIAVVASIWVSIDGGELRVDADVAERAAKTLLGVVLWLLLGVAIGSVVHNQVAALVGSLVWIFLVENLLVGLAGLLDADGLAEYLPFQALDGADGGGGGDNLLDYGPALAVALGWIALLGAAGLVRTRRRDIT